MLLFIFGCLLRTVVYCASLLFSFFVWALMSTCSCFKALSHRLMWFWLRFFKRWLMHAQTEGLFWWRIYPVKFFFQRFNTGEVQKGYGWTSQGVFCVFAVPPPPPPPPPPTRKKIFLSIVFNFSWDNCNTQEKWKTKLLQNLFLRGREGGHRGVLWEMCKWWMGN